MTPRGPYLCVSGIDGAGKSSQVSRLTAALRDTHPGTVQVKARLTALNGIFHLAEKLYGDPYAYHPQVPATLREFTIACDLLAWSHDTLRPLLTAGAPVVQDRSLLCYETYARCYGADLTWPSQLWAQVEQPDLILLLDVEPGVALARLAKRTEQPHQSDESRELLRLARETYLQLAAGRDDVVVIDATHHPEIVAATCRYVVRNRLGL